MKEQAKKTAGTSGGSREKDLVERCRRAEQELGELRACYAESLERRDHLSREISNLRSMVNLPQLYLDEDWRIVGYSSDFPLLTPRVVELTGKRAHVREILGYGDFRKITEYLGRVAKLEQLPFAGGGAWREAYRGPLRSDAIGESMIPRGFYEGETHWELEDRGGEGRRLVHHPHLHSELDCFLMLTGEFGGPGQDLRIRCTTRTSARPGHIRDHSIVIAAGRNLGSTTPDICGYTVCTASNANTEARIQRKGANLEVRTESLEPDTAYRITVELTGGRLVRRLENIRTGWKAEPLCAIDTDPVFDGKCHVGFHTYSAEAEFSDIEVFERDSRFEPGRFRIPFEVEAGIRDEASADRIFSLRLGRDTSMGHPLYVLLFEDITERRRNELSLRQSEEKFRTLFEESNQALCTLSRQREFMDINRAFEDLFGSSRGELRAGGPAALFNSPGDLENLLEEVEQKGEARDYELELRRGDGSRMDCAITAVLRRGSRGEAQGFQLGINDISDRKRVASRGVPFFGSSGRISEVMELAAMAARSETAVTLSGETGAGKGVLARWIHDHSRRSSHAFVEINCSGLKSQMLSSELFGHVKGAFTSAVQDRKGLVQVADGGTLFLDEISDMPLDVQAEFLKVIEEKQYRRLGEDCQRRSDFRLICSTNRDLFELVSEGGFRQDLYFRIQVFPIHLPPLRERGEELEPLVTHILHEAGLEAKQVLSSKAAAMLRAYPWPGNIRELRNVLERAVLLARGGQIEAEHLPGLERAGSLEVEDETDLNLKDLEKMHIREMIEHFGGDKERAAEALGISRATLYRKLKNNGD